MELRTGVLPPPGGELLEPLLGWPVPVAGRWSRRVRINVRFSRRGRRHLEPTRLVIRDPLGLDRREILGERGQELLVLPRVEPVEPVRGAGAKGSAADEGMQFSPSQRIERSTAELEIDGLRPYREGAPASRIHWPAVARSGEMIERRLVAGLDAAPLVVLDATRPPSEEALDAAVRAAASLCIHLARAGGCAILLPGERRAVEVGSDLGAWPAVHVRLALVEPAHAPPAAIHGGPERRGHLGQRPGRAPSAGGPRAALGRFALARLAGAPARHEGGLHGGGLHRRPARSRAAPAGGGGVSGAVARLAPAAPVAAEGARLDARPARRVHGPGGVRRGPLVGHGGGRAQRARRRGGGGGRRRRGPAVALTAPGAAASRRRDARRRRHLLMLCAGLAAAGLSLKLLLPGNWSELSDGLDRGCPGSGRSTGPTTAPTPGCASRSCSGAPLLLTAASALAFWPVRRYQSFWRAEALIALLLLYGVAVTNHDPGSPLTRGFVLLLLVAAWLWLPRLGRRDALVASVATLAAGVVSLPVAASLDGDQPWWDYRSFDWFGGGKSVVYDWNHRYGPIDWPRDGTTLMNVKSSQPLYWKTEVLDRFDGVRWLRVRQGSPRALAGLPDRFRRSGRSWDYFEYNPRWDRHVRVTVRSLRSDLVIGPGTIYQVSGAGATVSADDGTTFKLDEPLEKGDSYTVSAYAPKPNARQMRGAPTEFPAEVSRYTEIELPGQGTVEIPLRGDSFSGTPGAARGVARSEYGEVYRLARRLTAGAPTLYDAVARIQRHLRSRYTYDENPPRRSLPLAAFLLRDRVGYCQQFSGAMALMLRMVGIPTRVAAGFTPGSYNSDSGEFRVRDLDAHSWVEVFITGIGWVSFDPTPPAAPAETQSSGLETLASGGRDAGDVTSSRGDGATSEAAGGGCRRRRWRRCDPRLVGPAARARGAAPRRGRLGRLPPAAPAPPVRPRRGGGGTAAELESALPRLGWRLSGGSTLSGVESRLARVAGPAAASYAARLRAHRYEARPPDPPDRTARRDLRRALAAAAGRNGRLRALVAIPPGGPFRRL